MRTAAQMPIKFDVVEQQAPDSVDVADSEKKNFWRASGTVFGFNWLLWGYDRYIRKGDFAHISLNSVKENFKHGFKCRSLKWLQLLAVLPLRRGRVGHVGNVHGV